MNGPAHDESNWDTLLTELGVDPAPTSSKPALSDSPSPSKPMTPHREPVVKKKVETPEPAFGAFDLSPSPTAEKSPEVSTLPDEEFDPELDDTVIDVVPDLFGDSAPLVMEEADATEEAKEGEHGGRKRRRRRRRKKPGETAAGATPAADEDPADINIADEPESLAQEEELVEIADEAAPDLDDEVPEEIVPPTAIVEDEDKSTEPLPEWKVVAWTELIATLYRPQDR